MEKSSQIAWKIVPLRHFFPLKAVPLIEVLLYGLCGILGRDPGDAVTLRRIPARKGRKNNNSLSLAPTISVQSAKSGCKRMVKTPSTFGYNFTSPRSSSLLTTSINDRSSLRPSAAIEIFSDCRQEPTQPSRRSSATLWVSLSFATRDGPGCPRKQNRRLWDTLRYPSWLYSAPGLHAIRLSTSAVHSDLHQGCKSRRASAG
jgi:hypothetical protein